MKRLPIADCRLPIAELSPRGGLSRGRHNGCEFIGLDQQSRQLFRRHDASLGKQFQPQCGFVRFFFNGTDFGNEFRLATGTATGPVIGRYRSAAPKDLFRNDSAGTVVFWNGARHFNESQCEGLGSLLEFSGVHTRTIRNQSAIGNRQSAIGNSL